MKLRVTVELNVLSLLLLPRKPLFLLMMLLPMLRRIGKFNGARNSVRLYLFTGFSSRDKGLLLVHRAHRLADESWLYP